MITMFIELILSGVVFLILKTILERETPLYLGVYAQRGKWHYFKMSAFWVMMWVRQWKNKRAAGTVNQDKTRPPAGYGLQSTKDPGKMEKTQQLQEHPHALDSVYFNGMDSKGTYFVLRLGRRPGRKAEIWLSMQLPGMGFFQYPDHPDTAVYNTDGSTLSGGGVSIACLEPMRRWKVNFNGMLRKGLHNEWHQEKTGLVHVKFSFIWEAMTGVYDFDVDLHPGLVADAVAREKWTQDFWDRLKDNQQTHFEQWGELRGSLEVKGHDPCRVSLRGVRDRSYGIRDWRTYHRYIVHTGCLEDGTCFHISSICLPGVTSNLQAGYVALPYGETKPVTWSSLDLTKLGENGDPPDKYSFRFTAAGRSYNITVENHITPKYYHHEDWGTVIHERMANSTNTINGVKGYGISEFLYKHSGGCPVKHKQSVPFLRKSPRIPPNEHSALALPFTAAACTSDGFVGGKGCQLAILTQMDSKMFKVPSGFCLTLESFEIQLRENANIREKIEKLVKVASGSCEGSLPDTCQEVVEAVSQTQVCTQVTQALEQQLDKCLEGSKHDKMFAVRSSAAGEDSAEMSAAGQMDTLLGMKGKQQILTAVSKCWASQFAFQAVEYRRQHGQPIKSAMGVVVQEMVPSEASGVLFTRDPLTGNPAIMKINANYGLGESVVSGSSEPDTITLSRSWEDKIKLVNTEIGGKKTLIKTTDEGGTKESEVSPEESKKCSLSEETAVKLADIGIQLEKGFSDPRDIEWAVKGGVIYLLQARPITTLMMESDTDIQTEFDTALQTDWEALTTGNIGEMMPKAMTTLTLSTFMRATEYAFNDLLVYSGILQRHYYKTIHKFEGISSNHPFINMHYLYGVSGEEKRMADLAVLGQVLEDTTVEQIQQYWGHVSFYSRIIRRILGLFYARKSLEKTKVWEDKLAHYDLCAGHSDAAALYRNICDRIHDFYQCWCDTMTNSQRSGNWSMILMLILSQGKSEWTTQYYSDVAVLLSSCENVYSADVPAALQEMATRIEESGKRDEFIKMTTEDATALLLSKESGALHDKFNLFLGRHGHRCVREAEFREKSWRTDPSRVVSVLQTMLKSPVSPSANNKQQLSCEEAMSKIKTPLTSVRKYIMQWVLPNARKAVGDREWGKSIAIEMGDRFKTAYAKLASYMVQEGYLPDSDLLYFLTHQEIGKLLQYRSARLIARAQKRRRLHPKLMNLKFNRINTGHPVPITDTPDGDLAVRTTTKVTGMPVSLGKVQGPAKVVLSLEDAACIKPGDILIVNYTDVGWSPYFPLISGLVTEIGGLLSHGAVVAREYGLPCVVNIPNVTKMFKSGDEVILDGTNGILQKVVNDSQNDEINPQVETNTVEPPVEELKPEESSS